MKPAYRIFLQKLLLCLIFIRLSQLQCILIFFFSKAKTFISINIGWNPILQFNVILNFL